MSSLAGRHFDSLTDGRFPRWRGSWADRTRSQPGASFVGTFEHTRATLVARVVAFVVGSPAIPMNERLTGGLERVGAVLRSTGRKTAIQTSIRLSGWARKCRADNVPNTKCVRALTAVFEAVGAAGFVRSPTEDWLLVRRALESSDADELRRTADHARYLRLLRRGSAIEERLAELWRETGAYEGAETVLDEAILQDQLVDNHREASSISVMTMHQLKGREYDSVLLVEDQHRSFRGRDNQPPQNGDQAAPPGVPHESPTLRLHLVGDQECDAGSALRRLTLKVCGA